MIAEEGGIVTSDQVVASLEKADIADEVRPAQARVAAQSAQLAALFLKDIPDAVIIRRTWPRALIAAMSLFAGAWLFRQRLS